MKIPKGGNQNPYIEEEQTTQWPKEKGQKDKKSLKIPKGGNQNPYIEEEQTTQWPKEKVKKDKKRSTKHTHTTKDRVTRTPIKKELGFSSLRYR